MELALQVVGLRMTGRIEDAKQVAQRLVGGSGNFSGIAPSATVSGSTTPGASQRPMAVGFEGTLMSFLELLDTDGEMDVSPILDTATHARQTLLHLAAILGHHKLVSLLLALGASPDVRGASVQASMALTFARQVGLHAAALRSPARPRRRRAPPARRRCGRVRPLDRRPDCARARDRPRPGRCHRALPAPGAPALPEQRLHRRRSRLGRLAPVERVVRVDQRDVRRRTPAVAQRLVSVAESAGRRRRRGGRDGHRTARGVGGRGGVFDVARPRHVVARGGQGAAADVSANGVGARLAQVQSASASGRSRQARPSAASRVFGPRACDAASEPADRP